MFLSVKAFTLFLCAVEMFSGYNIYEYCMYGRDRDNKFLRLGV